MLATYNERDEGLGDGNFLEGKGRCNGY